MILIEPVASVQAFWALFRRQRSAIQLVPQLPSPAYACRIKGISCFVPRSSSISQFTAKASVYSGGAGRLGLNIFAVYHHGDTRGNRGVCSKSPNAIRPPQGKHSRIQLLLTNALLGPMLVPDHPAYLTTRHHYEA